MSPQYDATALVALLIQLSAVIDAGKKRKVTSDLFLEAIQVTVQTTSTCLVEPTQMEECWPALLHLVFFSNFISKNHLKQ